MPTDHDTVIAELKTEIRAFCEARDGPDAFYRGEIADLIVAEMERGDGLISNEDLDAIRPVWHWRMLANCGRRSIPRGQLPRRPLPWQNSLRATAMVFQEVVGRRRRFRRGRQGRDVCGKRTTVSGSPHNSLRPGTAHTCGRSSSIASLEDIFAIQTEIARAIAERLKVPLGLAESSQLVWPTRDVEAYDMYLAGRALLRARADLSQAVELFERTIARDSSWAPAWAGLAESHALIPYFRSEPGCARFSGVSSG